jgi:hypothetical protein
VDRREFADVANSPQQPVDACAEIVWTYFIESSFSEVAQAADWYPTAKHHRSADPILLKYFSLLRLGKQKEAENYLTSEAQDFVGDETEHSLLLEFQGRLQDHIIDLDQPSTRRRFEIFAGLQEEAAGKDDRAAGYFQGKVFARKDSLVALAARTELSRMKFAGKPK